MKTFKNLYTRYKYQYVTLLGHISLVAWIVILPLGWAVTLLIAGWVVSNLGHSLFMHRIFTHNHFNISHTLSWIGHIFFSMLNLGSPVVYASVHMKHHATSGYVNDPHNPYTLGFVRSLFSIWDEKFSPDRRFYKIFMKDPVAKKFHKHHFKISAASALVFPSAVVLGFWLSKLVTVVTHIDKLGDGENREPDTSRNVWWLKPITWGEELHNNHHRYVSRPNHNIHGTWREFDLIYQIGRIIDCG